MYSAFILHVCSMFVAVLPHVWIHGTLNTRLPSRFHSLNIFNSRLVLADADTATDVDFERIEGVVGRMSCIC